MSTTIPEENTNQVVNPEVSVDETLVNPEVPIDETLVNPEVSVDETIVNPEVNPEVSVDETIVNPEVSVDETVVNPEVPTEQLDSNPPPTEEAAVTPSNEITLKVDKSTLASLCQNLNSNLLVNIVAYKGVLTKLKDSESSPEKKTKLENNISNLDEIQESVSSLMKNVQGNLGVSQDNTINPEAVIEEASKSVSLADQLISAQVTSILASLAAAAILVGGKSKKKKITKNKRSKARKQTKRHH